jgi:2-C-methyl-D-erythritol 4-phosphate cytidylyltransferase
VDDAVGGLLAHKLPDTLKTAVTGPTGCAWRPRWTAATNGWRRRRRCSASARCWMRCRAGAAVTDEASAMEAMGLRPAGARRAQNFKVTYPDDFALAAAVLRSAAGPPRRSASRGATRRPPAATRFSDVNPMGRSRLKHLRSKL